jgi:hypothetical protein
MIGCLGIAIGHGWVPDEKGQSAMAFADNFF